MSSKMEEPSILQKIHVQHCPSSMHLPGSQAWISRIVNLPRDESFLNGEFCGHHLRPASQGSDSSQVPVLAQAPYERRFQNVASTSYMAGAMIVSTSVAAPLDRVRLLMQTQGEMISSGRLHKPYSGMRNCFARTIRNEGFMSLWRGNATEVARVLIKEAIKPALHKYFQGVFIGDDFEFGYWEALAASLAEAGLAHGATLFLLCPLRFAQTRLATNVLSAHHEKRQFSGLLDVLSKTLRSDGLSGIYRSYNIQFAGTALSNRLRDGLRSDLRPGLMLLFQSGFLGTLAAVAGPPLLANLCFYPMVTISRRMMMRSGEAVKYSSSIDALNKIVKNESIQAMYSVAPAAVLGTVLNVAVFLVFAGNAGSVPPTTFTVGFKTSRDCD